MSWETRKLDEVADFCLGKMLDKRKNKGDLRPYLANVNVRWGQFDFENLREMRFQEHELEKYGLLNGDIVMCEGGDPNPWNNKPSCVRIIPCPPGTNRPIEQDDRRHDRCTPGQITPGETASADAHTGTLRAWKRDLCPTL